MREALKEAKKALDEGGYGIGAVLVFDNKIIARAKAETHTTKDPRAHAETELIDRITFTKYFTPENLRKMTLVTTLEPCPMCYSTFLILKVGRIVYGARDEPSGFSPRPEMMPPIYRDQMPEVIGGVLEKECLAMFSGNREALDKKYLDGTLFEKTK